MLRGSVAIGNARHREAGAVASPRLVALAAALPAGAAATLAVAVVSWVAAGPAAETPVVAVATSEAAAIEAEEGGTLRK